MRNFWRALDSVLKMFDLQRSLSEANFSSDEILALQVIVEGVINDTCAWVSVYHETNFKEVAQLSCYQSHLILSDSSISSDMILQYSLYHDHTYSLFSLIVPHSKYLL